MARGSLVDGIANLVKSLGPGRIASMGAVALALVGFFAYLILRYNDVSQVPLYTGLTMEDSAAITQELDGQNVPYTLKDNGSIIMVPDADVLKLRMTLAEAGLPSGGGVGYEIFDKTDALGTTSFVQSVNALRALEGELSRTIRTIRKVEQARVHLVLPEKQLFRKEEQKPTASIVLKTRGELDPGQVRAIQHLVASAVPGLEPSRISVVDETGRMLAQGTGDDDTAYLASTADERTASVQKQVEERVRDIVESVVGAGRVRVRVAADLDMNRVTQTQDTFDPNGQVVRSTQTREEKSASQDQQPNDQVTAGNQVPNANANANNGGAGAQSNQNANTTEETVNYEISKTTRTQITESGGVKRLSVAVLVDGRYQTDAQGVQTYTPRPQAELDQISALVRTAMGFDQNRGDQLQVVNLQFADGPAAPTDNTAPGLFDFSKDDIVRFAEMGVMLILSLLVLLFAVRPLIRRIVAPEIVAEEAAIAAQAAAQTVIGGTPGSTTLIIGPNGQSIPVEIGADGKPLPVLIDANGQVAAAASRIDEAKAAGAVHLDQIRQVGELVAENPNEAAILIRTWLSEAA